MLVKAAIVIGILGVLLGIAVTAVSALLPELTSGRVSWEEAALGIVPGLLVLMFSGLMVIVAVIVLIIQRNKKN
ncbi:MAG: hypothetical protein IPM50_13175 [Acidobacteriota bacterium]|nr:MAG: hypothetical protein IPM50_13175 [Acidobacteriota bacterium]